MAARMKYKGRVDEKRNGDCKLASAPKGNVCSQAHTAGTLDWVAVRVFVSSRTKMRTKLSKMRRKVTKPVSFDRYHRLNAVQVHIRDPGVKK